jgi:hypothetical protein
MKFKAVLKLTTITLFGLLTSTYVLAQTVADNIPDVVEPCIPARQIRFFGRSATLITQTHYEAKDYYLLQLVREDSLPDQPTHYMHVVAVSGTACEVVYTNPTNDVMALSSQLPQSVANQLILGQMQHVIETIGRTEFERRIHPLLASGRRQDFSPEVVWALEQLDFPIDKE